MLYTRAKSHGVLITDVADIFQPLNELSHTLNLNLPYELKTQLTGGCIMRDGADDAREQAVRAKC